jgi:ubiquinone/menaquinone biosynthesis C-methylase UbiE
MNEKDFSDLFALEQEFWWFKGMRKITASLLDPYLLPASDRSILDAGCGTGGMLSWLTRYSGNGEVVGIDISPIALEFCRKSNNNELYEASVTRLPFKDSSFDVVTSFDVLVQLPGENGDEIALKEMYRVLKPGGIAFVRVAAYNWMRSGHDKAIESQKRYIIPSINRMLEKEGFQILRSTYANTFLFPLAIIRRLILKPIGLVDKGSDVRPLPKGFEWLNKLFTAFLNWEARILKTQRISFCMGLSVITIVKKPMF